MIKDNKSGAIVIEGHVQGLSNTRALGEMGVPVIVIDQDNCIARYSKYCMKFYKCPDYLSEEFIAFLLKLGERENLKGWTLIPSNDHIVYNLSKNKDKISAVYKTIVPDIDSLMKIYDKNEFLTAASKKNVPIPKTFLFNEIQNHKSLSYPILIKGKEGLTFFKATGKKGYVVNNQSELERFILGLSKKIETDKILAQEIIPFNDSSDVWSFTAFAINGETKTFWIGKKLREHPAKFGTATFAMSDYDENVEKYGKKIIKMLYYTGCCEIEFIKDKSDNTFKLIEMNPRTWLWVSLARHCGIDFTKYIYEYLNEIQSIYPDNYKKEIKWINFWTYSFFSLKSVINRNLSIGEFLRQNKGQVICAVYDKNDLIPFIMLTLMLPYLIYKRT